MWENIAEPGRSQTATWRMRVCWILKSKNTHSEYVILIAFPTTTVARKRLNVTSYYTVCLVSNAKRPDRLWDPPTLLPNECWGLFPLAYIVGCDSN
jgi:hypothetical protein